MPGEELISNRPEGDGQARGYFVTSSLTAFICRLILLSDQPKLRTLIQLNHCLGLPVQQGRDHLASPYIQMKQSGENVPRNVALDHATLKSPWWE
jgi:hypothetical protein